jgi:hypothetical protein
MQTEVSYSQYTPMSFPYAPYPKITFPGHNQANVLTNATFTWALSTTDLTGALEACVFLEQAGGLTQERHSLVLGFDSTSWSPSQMLLAGANAGLDVVAYHGDHSPDSNGVLCRTACSVENEIVFTTAPEPATLSLLALGGLGVLLRRRRR